jgi:Flp pilus assembly protein TadD
MAVKPAELQKPDPNTYLAALVKILSQADPERTTNREVQQQITSLVRAKDEQTRVETPIIYYSDKNELFLGNQELAELYQAFEQIEQQPVHQAVEFLEEVIQRREAQNDLWPEGRLELGIAYAALGEWEQARKELDEVIMICESGGRYMSENMAMAA